MTWPWSFLPWWLQQSAAVSQGQALISRCGAPGWHLGHGGGLRMGKLSPDSGGESWGGSGQGVRACPLPATCQGLPGHAGTCLR